MGEHGFGYEFEYKTKPNTNDIVKDTIEFYREEAERLNKIGATTYYEEQVRDILNKIIGIGTKEVKQEKLKTMPDQLAEMTKAGQYGSLFKDVEITNRNLRDTTTGKPAPSGVGERKLYQLVKPLNKDIEILKSDDPIAIKEG